jgi:hypothetical protein
MAKTSLGGAPIWGLILAALAAGTLLGGVVGLTFEDLASPPQLVEVPAHEIRPWAYRSAAFDVDIWPAAALERAIREPLRMFGYVAVDELIAALNLQAPPSDPATAN